MAYETVSLETRGHVGLITFDRPDALNALNNDLMRELAEILGKLDADDSIGAIILTGSEKAFAAGADIKEMAELSFPQTFQENFAGKDWVALEKVRKPVIAAVSGYALGGGCEIALACDIVLASETARFGLPEITLGVIPGIGGTQRLTHAVGKAKAMEMILTGRFITAEEAERAGVVSRIIPEGEDLVEEAIQVGEKIAGMSQTTAAIAKSAVNRAFETGLSEGILYERMAFYSLFATEDQKEGMEAFIDKRQAQFRNR